MDTQMYNLTIRFTETLLGTQPQREVATEFLASKIDSGELPEDEQETLHEMLERERRPFIGWPVTRSCTITRSRAS